jgi:alpha-L-fucosidase
VRKRGGSGLVTPRASQATWQDFELGLVYHFDLDVYMPGGHRHEDSRRQLVDPRRYQPAKLDTDQWVESAVAMGARYAIFTATHHQGFLQWQSDVYPFGLKQAPWRKGKGDIVGDFVESCRKRHVAPGVYIGIRFNAYHKVYQYKVNGGKGGTKEEQARYVRVCERMVEELCSRYGELCEIWFDGGVISPRQGGPNVLPIVTKHQPNAVFYHSPDRADHRWAGNEAGTTGYPCWATMPSLASQTAGHRRGDRRRLLGHGDPDGTIWCPPMCDAPIREHDWLWRPGRENRVQPLERLVDTMYYRSVGRNGNLILGAVPDADGLIPEPDVKRYTEFGREIRRRFGTPLAETASEGPAVMLSLRRPTRIDHVSIMEDIRQGERVRAYVVEGLTGPDRWERLCDGISIGHRRIQRFPPVEVGALRLRITRSVARPCIRSFAAFAVS